MQFKNLFNHGKYGDAINYNVLLCKQQYSEKNIAIKLDDFILSDIKTRSYLLEKTKLDFLGILKFSLFVSNKNGVIPSL